MERNKITLQKLEYLFQEIAESIKEEVALINNLSPEETYASYLKHLAASTGILGKLDLKERHGHADHVSGDGQEALLDTEDSFGDWVHVIHPVAEFERDSTVSSAMPPTTKSSSVTRPVRYWLGLTADTIVSATADILVSVTAAILRIILTTILDRVRALDKIKGILKGILKELEKINPEIREIVTALVCAKVMIKIAEEDESEVLNGYLEMIEGCLLQFQKKNVCVKSVSTKKQANMDHITRDKIPRRFVFSRCKLPGPLKQLQADLRNWCFPTLPLSLRRRGRTILETF